MGFLNFSKTNCKNCYKCLRYCPVKAIKIKDEQAEIVEEKCIACGHCLLICPQNARNIKSDVDKVFHAIKNNKRVVASIAPSFMAAFEVNNSGKIASALKHLGFFAVEETAVGAEVVSNLYKDYYNKCRKKNIITTCCPSVNYLIEDYFPSLVKYMIPVVSPMIAHGQILKYKYGVDTFVVFIGPCIAKKYEAADLQHEGIVDAVITFEDLMQMFIKENINVHDEKAETFDGECSSTGRAYPLAGGVLNSFVHKESENPHISISVNGIEECFDVFRSMENGDIDNVCVEANICKGSCSGGPGIIRIANSFCKNQQRIRKYIKSKEYPSKKCVSDVNHEDKNYFINLAQEISFSKVFYEKRTERKLPSEEEVMAILRNMGKHEPEDELNCGVCGYNTCREKAVAVYEGMAEYNMCLHYMRSKAESLTNGIFENTPNIIIFLDDKLMVKEFNPTAEKLFNIAAEEISGKPISILIDPDNFYKVIETRKNLYRQKVSYEEYGLVLIQDILFLEKENTILAIMSDITHEERNKGELKKVKENTLNAAQEVINKQMRVAQEIASLLGETTAETKIILTKLKKLVAGEDGDGCE